MLDKIGIIGNIQGVKASKRPKPKNVIRISHILPPAKTPAILSCSEPEISFFVEIFEMEEARGKENSFFKGA